MEKKMSMPGKTAFYIGITVLALAFMFPLIWMVVSSFKDDAMILAVMVIPAQTVMLPQFSIIYKMGLANS